MNQSLKESVLNQLGYNSDDLDPTSALREELIGTLSDIANHGIDGGFGGFIYYSDTVSFFNDNRSDILELVSEMASDFGMSPADMIAGFGCLDDDRDTRLAIDAVLMNIDNGADESDITQIKNALAWFAGEELARDVA